MYPYRTDEQQAALDRLAHGPYVSDDKPYLSTERYSLSGFEPHHLEDKEMVDAQGLIDNWWWYKNDSRRKAK